MFPFRRVLTTWWPLAASWLLMSAELPALSAVIARLPDPEINLAAYGGVVFPLALIIESPIIMLLTASTALSKDMASYQRIRRFMLWTSMILTGFHLLVAFTPLYDLVVRHILGAPQEIIEPARLGLKIMTPWTWSIAFRRFNQGVLIRFGRSRSVGTGTVIRLLTDGLVLTLGYLLGRQPGGPSGIVVAASAVAVGVICEAVYAGMVVRPVLRNDLRLAPPVPQELSWSSFAAFYIPLAMTSLLSLIVQPIGSASLSRMPQALESLAVWPVVSGLLFMFRSGGMALNEVVVALLDESSSSSVLRRFTYLLAFGFTALLLFFITTPLAHIWFQEISALPIDLAQLAQTGMWLVLPMPALGALQSWFQGALLHSRHTKAITEAVIVFLVINGLTLLAGVLWGGATGLYIGLGSFTISTLMQTAWLWIRSQPAIQSVFQRDQALAAGGVSGSPVH